MRVLDPDSLIDVTVIPLTNMRLGMISNLSEPQFRRLGNVKRYRKLSAELLRTYVLAISTDLVTS